MTQLEDIVACLPKQVIILWLGKLKIPQQTGCQYLSTNPPTSDCIYLPHIVIYIYQTHFSFSREDSDRGDSQSG